MIPARDVAVDAIADGRDGEAEDGSEAMDLISVLDVIEHFDHEDGHQQDSENGNLVGGRHAGGRILCGRRRDVNGVKKKIGKSNFGQGRCQGIRVPVATVADKIGFQRGYS
jgi:hypothetical protein